MRGLIHHNRHNVNKNSWMKARTEIEESNTIGSCCGEGCCEEARAFEETFQPNGKVDMSFMTKFFATIITIIISGCVGFVIGLNY